MKVTFILPAIGKKKGERYIKTWQKMEPLTISTLKSVTPDHVETEFFDDRIELIDYETKTDLVALTSEVYTAKRAYSIAKRFRDRGIPVIIGGYHASLCPDEILEYADSVLIGNAESVWKDIIADAEKKRLKERYHGPSTFADVLPDRSIFNGKKYSRMGVIETGRGCNFSCEFCAITAFHKGKYHRKEVSTIVEDIKAAKKAGKDVFFFADDNVVADPEYAIKLFKAITPLKIRWTGQGTLTMARNDELLYWMKQSGCTVILIGYESLEKKNLQQMDKDWTTHLGELDELTEKVHSAGLNIYATFVFGFDYDSPELFDRTLEFSLKHSFYFAAFNHLLVMPGTKLHDRMIREDKLINDRWWLDENYRYGEIVFRPKSMSQEELSQHCRRIRKKFYSKKNIFKRSIAMWKRTHDLMLYIYFWYLNLKLGEEVDGKMGLPMGENLDELPK